MMPVLRLYQDNTLEAMLSAEGDFSNPDEESSLDGGAGQTADRSLWLAVEQTTLAADIPDVDTTQVVLSAPRFADTAYVVLIVGTEKMLVMAGHGSNSLTVLRGHNGTPKSTHAAGDPVRLAYDCSGIEIACVDTLGPDESGWVSYCLDSGGGSWCPPAPRPRSSRTWSTGSQPRSARPPEPEGGQRGGGRCSS